MKSSLSKISYRPRFIAVILTVFQAAASAQGQSIDSEVQHKRQTKASTIPVYSSVFTSYQKYTDQSVQPWRSSNEAVRKAGGWKAYSLEAQKPDIEAPAAAPDERKPQGDKP